MLKKVLITPPMKKLFSLMIILLVSRSLFSEVTNLAILKFDVEGNEMLGSSLSEIATSLFKEHSSIELIERRDFQKIIEEHKIQLSGFVDEEGVGKLFQLKGAAYIGIGYVTYLNRDDMNLVFKIVDTETGIVETSNSISLNNKDEIIEGVKYVVLKTINELEDQKLRLPEIEYATSIIKDNYISFRPGGGVVFPLSLPTVDENFRMEQKRVYELAPLVDVNFLFGKNKEAGERQLRLHLLFTVKEIEVDGDLGHSYYPLNQGVHFSGIPLDCGIGLAFLDLKPKYHDGYSHFFKIFPELLLHYTGLYGSKINYGPSGISFNSMAIGANVNFHYGLNAYISKVMEFEVGFSSWVDVIRFGYLFSESSEISGALFFSALNQIGISAQMGVRFRY